MIEISKIKEAVEAKLTGTEMFLVDIRELPGPTIEIIVDSDGSMGIDTCIQLSKSVEAMLDRDQQDFELTVMSAGIGQPLKLLRQYRKLIGKDVEVVTADGTKYIAELADANEDGISIRYDEKIAAEGKKRKETVTREQQLPFGNIKTTKEHLSFK